MSDSPNYGIRRVDLVSWVMLALALGGSMLTVQRKWDYQQHQVESNSKTIQRTVQMLDQLEVEVRGLHDWKIRHQAMTERIE